MKKKKKKNRVDSHLITTHSTTYLDLLVGMSSATETLCGQAFRAKQYHMLGICLQCSWIIDVTTATILTPLFIFSAPIFKLLGQEEDIAIATENISLCKSIQMYLQAQLKNMIVGWLSAFSFVFHVFLSWIFVSVLKFEIPGAMVALNISSWSMVIGAFVYVFGGCLQLWYNAILLLLAGYLKNVTVSISAFSICLNFNTWEAMLTLGFLVSNELGKGNAKVAKFAIKYILSTSSCIGVVFWILCLVFGHDIGYLFTSNEKVAETTSSLSVLLAFSILPNSVQPILSGMAIGAGWQSKVAYINVGSYYIIGGMWIGMICGVVVQGMMLTYMTWRTDWDEQVRETSERLNRWFLKPSEESNEGPSQA
ncbi:hypothetical protein PVL29_002425 [Vitis rotundifolia]|uniref:Multi antimicrobial extrusion protein n=1 Tax=Vitis rotundifolia TaxID=103349 RepID=A0AA39AGV4_VITRO|nr:hypothetical protein PVL29_002425 [Vitis rotundifolia]